MSQWEILRRMHQIMNSLDSCSTELEFELNCAELDDLTTEYTKNEEEWWLCVL